MVRSLRIEYPGALFYVRSCGNERQNISFGAGWAQTQNRARDVRFFYFGGNVIKMGHIIGLGD